MLIIDYFCIFKSGNQNDSYEQRQQPESEHGSTG